MGFLFFFFSFNLYKGLKTKKKRVLCIVKDVSTTSSSIGASVFKFIFSESQLEASMIKRFSSIEESRYFNTGKSILQP